MSDTNIIHITRNLGSINNKNQLIQMSWKFGWGLKFFGFVHYGIWNFENFGWNKYILGGFLQPCHVMAGSLPTIFIKHVVSYTYVLSKLINLSLSTGWSWYSWRNWPGHVLWERNWVHWKVMSALKIYYYFISINNIATVFTFWLLNEASKATYNLITLTWII